MADISTFSLDEKTKSKLKRLAQAYDSNKSEVIRNLVDKDYERVFGTTEVSEEACEPTQQGA